MDFLILFFETAIISFLLHHAYLRLNHAKSVRQRRTAHPDQTWSGARKKDMKTIDQCIHQDDPLDLETPGSPAATGTLELAALGLDIGFLKTKVVS